MCPRLFQRHENPLCVRDRPTEKRVLHTHEWNTWNETPRDPHPTFLVGVTAFLSPSLVTYSLGLLFQYAVPRPPPPPWHPPWSTELGEALLLFLREGAILPPAWISSSWLHSAFVQYWFLSSECLSAVWLQLFLFGVRFGVRSVNTYCQHLICVPFTYLTAVSLHNVYIVKSRCFLHPGLPPSHPFNVLRICSTR